MASSVDSEAQEDGASGVRRSRRSANKPPPRLESSELSEIEDSNGGSSDDSLVIGASDKRASRRKSAGPKIDKIIKRIEKAGAREPVYLCRTKGSKQEVKLKESELKHVPELLSSFKRKVPFVTIQDSDESAGSESENSLTESEQASDDSSSSHEQNQRKSKRLKKNGKATTSTRSSKAARAEQPDVRRSTRGTRHQGKFDFSVHQPDEEEEQDELLTDESSDDDVPVLSSKRRSTSRTNHSAQTNAKLRVGDRPRDQHESTCAKCSGEFRPDLVNLWIKADKHRKSKVRAGTILDRFHNLEEVYSQGCWLECSNCTLSYHFGCLPHDMKKDIAAQHKKERDLMLKTLENGNEDPSGPTIDKKVIPPPKKERQPDLKLSIKCPFCVKNHGLSCMECGKENSPPDPTAASNEVDHLADSPRDAQSQPLLFRCTSCKRPAHYLCLPPDGEKYPTDLDKIADYWQSDWNCKECTQLSGIAVEFILAWRHPVPKAKKPGKDGQPVMQELVGSLHDQPKGRNKQVEAVSAKLPNPKDAFEQAEYLCKYEEFSFTDCSWVTHSYLVATHPAKLRNFLTKGPLLDLKQFSGGDDESDDADSDADDQQGTDLPFNLNPDADAQLKIPKAWLTPEKILSIEFEDEVLVEDLKEQDVPSTPEEMYEQMERAYVKWEERPYAAATWSDKTPKDSPYFPAFMSALEKYMKFRKFAIPVVRTDRDLAKLDAPRREKDFVALEKQPNFIPNQLMGFQLEGLNFCYYNWHRQHPTILADEMGLGKTVQICSLIAVLNHMEKRMPFLIVVPNSTLGNWARECAKWIPNLKCVPLPGDADSCSVVEEWELFKSSKSKSKRQLATHVVLATYQSAENNANLLRSIQRWEVVIVDEGQRLKSGPKGGLFRALTSLRAGHKILMSGTPLNNNLRELFNLLSFLNPEKYPASDIDELELRYAALTPELIEELRTIIRPYMLRRTKETALDLPKLTELIVPITMRPLQKQIYKGILSRNVDLITSIYTEKKKKKTTRAGFQNVLMELRKALAHPYLNDWQIEPSNVTEAQAHENLVQASAKLVFLQKFIPKLLARGHRMLVFSQFTMFLDIVERFLDGEKLEFLRLDGNTAQLDRQARIDNFNRKGSHYHIFLLSTKAGGAGINLATADTVIVLDPDWNPHNDLQAISRAHRFGQKKPVSVFKLMVKGSAEEKIVQTGKRKLVLDHLVIQKAAEEEIEANDVENILQYGAQELLTESDEALKKDVRYTDEELDDLIQRTAEENKSNESADGTAKKVDKSFAFARVWEGRGKELSTVDSLEDKDQAGNVEDQRTFWDNILQANQEEERAKNQVEVTATGRGYRKRRDVDYNIPQIDSNPNSPKKARFDDDSGHEPDDNFMPNVNDDGADSSILSDAEPEVLTNLSGPHLPSALEMAQSRAAEEASRAERRKRKLKDKYERELRLSQQAMSNPSDSTNHKGILNQTSKSTPAGSGSQKKSKTPKVSTIEIPDLQGLSNTQRRQRQDMILRDIILKTKALKDPTLDSMLTSLRTQSDVQQTETLLKMSKMIKKLAVKVDERNQVAKYQQQEHQRHQAYMQPGTSHLYQLASHPHQVRSHPQQNHPHPSTSHSHHSIPYQHQASPQPPRDLDHPQYYQQVPPAIPMAMHQYQPYPGLQFTQPSRQSMPLHMAPTVAQPAPLPPPRFSQTNPKTIMPLVAQQTAHLYRPFSSTARPPTTAPPSAQNHNPGPK